MSAAIKKTFASAVSDKPKKLYPKPVSIRFTDAERAELESKAGDLTLSAYVRSCCVGDVASAHRTRGKRPVKDYEALSRVLGALGRSKLSNNVNQIAKAVNTGSMSLDGKTAQDLRQAAYDIACLRMYLIKALGLKDGGK